jgi:dTDP-glucose pyrophosphorylase
MEVAILAGDQGTRRSEDKPFKPETLVEMEGKPIHWHCVTISAVHGRRE